MWIQRFRLDDLVERIEHVDFLSWCETARILMNRHTLCMFHHMKVTCGSDEHGILDIETGFAAKMGQHKILDKDIPLCPANMRPLLISGQEGTVKAR